MVIGLFIQVEWHWHWPKVWSIVSGVVQAAEAEGVRVLIYSDPGAPERGDARDFDQLAKDFAYDKHAVDGFVLTFPDPDFQKYAQQLHSRGVPVIAIGRRAGEVPRVLASNYDAVLGAVKELAGRGHRRIAFVAGPSDNLCATERLRGYRDGLRACGLPPNPELEVHEEELEETRYRLVARCWDDGLRFTALVSFNDTVAIGALDALRQRGVRVPEEVEVIGFDNVPHARWTTPPLSTFELPGFELGHLAATRLIQRIRSGAVVDESVIPTPFIRRRSTASSAAMPPARFGPNVDWSESEYYCRVQMQRLRAHPAAAALLDRIGGAGLDASRLPLFSELLALAVTLGFPVRILYPLLNGARASVDPEQQGAVFEAFLQLANAAVDEQRRQLESGVIFAASSLPLRELSVEAADEDTVVERLRGVLGDLGVAKAALFLSSLDGANQNGGGRFWDFGRSKAAPSLVPEPDFQAFLEQQGSASAFFVMPLHYKSKPFGLIALDATSSALLHYPDLVGQLSAALHAVRMHLALLQANRELVEASRMAGIAEMATGILHNIGNALNSVNTTANVAADRLRASKVGNVTRIADMLQENRHRLDAFVSEDERGRMLLDYAAKLGRQLEQEQQLGIQDFDALREKIEHLNEIVAAQQSYANVAGVAETVAAEELCEHALRICSGTGWEKDVRVERSYMPVPLVRVPRQKALQVLVNLLNNATDALAEAETPEKRIRVEIGLSGRGWVSIAVSDNGVGINPENLTRIFAFGFTTKAEGHGFGLHSSALAAKEMGGALYAASAGIRQGATFTVELPPAESARAGTLPPFAREVLPGNAGVAG